MPDRPRVVVTAMAVRGPRMTGPAALAELLAATRSTQGEAMVPHAWEAWLDGLAVPLAARARRVGRTAAPGLRVALALAVEAAGEIPPAGLGLVVAGSNLEQGRAAEAFRKHAEAPHYLTPRFGYEFYDTNVMASIAAVLGAEGPGLTVGGASASGNVAILTALDLIRAGRAPAVLVVGPVPDLSPAVRHALAAMGALGTAPARPFDRAASGFVPGDIAAAVLLEDAAHAAARGAVALAEIAGAALVTGASHLPDPDAASEARAMSLALADAGEAVEAVDLVSAHATGTPAGDAAECEALRQVLGPRAADVPVNAPKSLFGHGLHAAGVVELAALVIQMRAGLVHGTAGLGAPIADDLWLVGPAPVARPVGLALSNSFGFGTIASTIAVRNVGALS